MKIELKDLECYDEMYYVGHLVDVDGSGWVDEFEAQKLLDEINQPEPVNPNGIDTPTLIVIMILMMGLINGLMSCSPRYGCPAQKSLIKGTVHKPTKREIKRAMSYSSWEYAQPEVQIMIPGTKSNYIFTSNK